MFVRCHVQHRLTILEHQAAHNSLGLVNLGVLHISVTLNITI
jgi:hypothetical protein